MADTLKNSLRDYPMLANPALDDASADGEQPLPTIRPQAPPAGQLQTIRQQPAPPAPLPKFQRDPFRQQQEQGLQQSLAPKPSPTGFFGKAGRILEGIGNAAGTIFLGNNVMSGIPGSAQNNALKQGSAIRQLNDYEDKDRQDEQQFDKTQQEQQGQPLREAQTREANARADSLENPQDKADKFTFQQTDHGLMRIDSTTGEATPVTYQGQPLQPKPAQEKGIVTDLKVGGKEHNVLIDPTTGKQISDLGERGEKPVQAPGVTVMVPNADGGYSVQRAGVGQKVASGAVTAAGMNSLNVPTSSTRTMVETAPRVIELADRVEQLIDPQIQTLGPAASRWAEFMAGKVGAPNPEFTKLRTNVGLLSTALMRMHVGARGGEQIMQHFQDLMDSSKQSPENLKAALDEIKSYAHQVAGEAGPGHGGTANPSNGAQGAEMVRARDPQGNLHEAPKGTALPKGWTPQ